MVRVDLAYMGVDAHCLGIHFESDCSYPYYDGVAVVKQKLRASAMSILAKHGVNSPSEVTLFTFPSAPSPPPTCKPADNFACPFVLLSDRWDLHGTTFESFDTKRVNPSIESRKALIVTVAGVFKIVPGFEYDMENKTWVEVPPNKVESRLHAYTTKRQLTCETSLVIVTTNGKLSFLVDKGNGALLDVNDEEAQHATETKEAAKSLMQRWLELHSKDRVGGMGDGIKLMMMDECALIEDEYGSLRYAKVEEEATKPNVKISATRKKKQRTHDLPISDRELREKRPKITDLRAQEEAAAAEQQRQREEARKKRLADEKKAEFEKRKAFKAAQRATADARKQAEREEKKRKQIQDREEAKKQKLTHEKEMREMQQQMQRQWEQQADAAQEAAKEMLRAIRTENEKEQAKLKAEMAELKKAAEVARVKQNLPCTPCPFVPKRMSLIFTPFVAGPRH